MSSNHGPLLFLDGGSIHELLIVNILVYFVAACTNESERDRSVNPFQLSTFSFYYSQQTVSSNDIHEKVVFVATKKRCCNCWWYPTFYDLIITKEYVLRTIVSNESVIILNIAGKFQLFCLRERNLDIGPVHYRSVLHYYYVTKLFSAPIKFLIRESALLPE